MITIKDDGKGKSQSVEASISQDGSTHMGYYLASFTGYGASEYEAKLNVIEQVDNLIKNLKRIKDSVEV